MALKKSSQRLSKFITYVLGYRPDEFGLVLDPQGYIKIKELLKALHEEDGWRHVRKAHLNEILLTESNPPIEINGNLIRSTSRERLVAHDVAENPPKLLYTCVRRKAYPWVLEKGILPRDYPQVILSSSPEMAERMGRRIDSSPVLLTIHVQKSIEEGILFFQAGETLYLAKSIHAGCFSGPPLPKEKPESKKPEKPEKEKPETHPGSFLLDLTVDKPPQKSSRRSGKKKEIAWKNEQRRKKKQHQKERPPWRT